MMHGNVVGGNVHIKIKSRQGKRPSIRPCCTRRKYNIAIKVLRQENWLYCYVAWIQFAHTNQRQVLLRKFRTRRACFRYIRGSVFDRYFEIPFSVLESIRISTGVLKNSQYFIRCTLNNAQAPLQTCQVTFLDQVLWKMIWNVFCICEKDTWKRDIMMPKTASIIL